MIEAMEHPHLVPYDLLIPFDFLLRHGLQYDLVFDVPWHCQSGGIACGVEGVQSGRIKVAGGQAARRLAWAHCSGVAI